MTSSDGRWMSTVKCTCGASANYYSDGSHTVGDCMRKTMYRQVRTEEEHIWLCPICQVELRRVMRILAPMLAYGNPTWSDLTDFLKPDSSVTVSIESV